MSSLVSRLSALILVLAFAGVTACSAGDRANSTLPTPAVDAPMVSANGEQTAVIAGGCFWGIQAVFQHTKGVISATSGYSGGSAKTAEYELVSTGETGHAESVAGPSPTCFRSSRNKRIGKAARMNGGVPVAPYTSAGQKILTQRRRPSLKPLGRWACPFWMT